MQLSSKSSKAPFLSILSLWTAFLLLLTVSWQPVSAAPLDAVATSHKSLTKRACPSLVFLETYLITKGVGGNSVFYTGKATNQQAKNFAVTLSPPGHYWGNTVDTIDTLEWIDECNTDVPAGSTAEKEQDKVVPRTARALAAQSEGTAYVLIPSGDDINGVQGSIWNQYEYPTLMHTGKIDKVIRVDPENWSIQSTAWKKGDQPTLPPPTGP